MVITMNLLSCANDNKETIDYKKGTLKGTIGLYEGDCTYREGILPCQPSPILATVAITRPSYNFDMNLLVDSIVTSGYGKFEINLPTGTYSLFIRDGANFICDYWTCPSVCYCTPFKIKSDSVTIINANIDHASW